ncbi:hypothetical protein [Methylophaga thalassica]|uniref:hypothetical protein n=1 Tax=Methylophaga thalassica TaxID=40223 RepID=UPI002E7ACA4B|nr:hypothetical protein [Methylophaga thalassica]WVI83929.1 hypothetical protein VSX76_00835 [Methylophaga thalassica]
MDKAYKNRQFELSDYTLKRLVFINSAGHGYSEIILDESMVIYGVNNVGKTGSLAGIKIALYPQVNFFQCDKTFRFTGKDGAYRYDDSYDYYFPDPRSYIVLEVENPQGKFCMVCYRTSNYHYSRFFIPQEYARIRSLFSNEDSGEINPHLNTSLIEEYRKKHNGIKVSDQKELVQRMFSGHYGTPEESRYCVLPLQSLNDDAIQAFRSIYQLSFESGKSSQESLPSAIAALVEMSRDRNKERLDTNFSELVDEYESLYAEDTRLLAIKNAEPLYQQAKKSFDTAKQLYQSYSVQVNALLHSYKKDYETFQPDLKAAEEAADLARKTKKRLDIKLLDKNREYNRKEGEYKTHCERLKKDKQAVIDGKELLGRYPGKSQKEVLDMLDEDIDSLTTALKQYDEQNGAEKRLQMKVRERNKLIKEIDELKVLVANTEKTFLYQIENDHSRLVLHSLNQELAKPMMAITGEDKNIINAFTALFDFDGADFLTLKGATIEGVKKHEYDPEKILSEWSEKLSSKNDILTDLDDEIKELNEQIKQDNVQFLINRDASELKQTKADRLLIAGIESKEEDVRDGEEKEAVLKGEIETLKSEKKLIEEQQARASAVDIKKNEAVGKLVNKKNGFNTIKQRLNDAIQRISPSTHTDTSLTLACSLEAAENIQQLAIDLQASLNEVDKYYHRLDAEFKHPDIDRDRVCSEMGDFERNIQIYTTSYATLANDLDRLLYAIKTHNQRINSQLNELREADEALQREVRSINTQMNEKTISNLKDVTIHVHKKAAFNEILNSLKKHDIDSEKFIDAEFYRKITRFSSDFFDKKSGRLRLKDIIERITPSYTKRDTGKVEDKGQSGGTTTTINAFLMSVLLSRITQAGIRLKMPIIVDEIGTLDHANAPATIAQITGHGFSIFCATPEYSALINKKVGRWARIDRFYVNNLMVDGCNLKSLPKHVESIGKL